MMAKKMTINELVKRQNARTKKNLHMATPDISKQMEALRKEQERNLERLKDGLQLPMVCA